MLSIIYILKDSFFYVSCLPTTGSVNTRRLDEEDNHFAFPVFIGDEFLSFQKGSRLSLAEFGKLMRYQSRSNFFPNRSKFTDSIFFLLQAPQKKIEPEKGLALSKQVTI